MHEFGEVYDMTSDMADHNGYKLFTYALAILLHIYTSFHIFKVCKTIAAVH